MFTGSGRQTNDSSRGGAAVRHRLGWYVPTTAGRMAMAADKQGSRNSFRVGGRGTANMYLRSVDIYTRCLVLGA